MFSTTKRLLAAGTASAVALLGYGWAAPAQAAPAQLTAPATIQLSATQKAAKWFVAHPATADDGYAGQLNSALGLAVLDTSATSGTLRTWLAGLRTGVDAGTKTSLGNQLRLTILLDAVHQNPKTFGGVKLITRINSQIAASGQVGSYGSAFTQALTIIALARSGQKVPTTVVTTLVSFQDATSGAFGYEWNGFNADPDSTALAIQALKLIGKDKTQLDKAISWAQKNQNSAGYWASFSPVDTTGLMATALKQAGKSYRNAREWLLTQQLADGGFPAELNGTSSNLMATTEGSYLLARESLATTSYSLKGYSKSPRPTISGKAKVGRTLTAHAGKWSPSPALSYQWYRSGKKISGATARSYTTITKDKGKRLSVRVKATGLGLKIVTKLSRTTAKVAHR